MLENLKRFETRLHDYVEENGIIINSSYERIIDAAYMTTQYINYGEACLDDLYNYIIDELMDSPEVCDYNDYFSENGYEDDYIYDMDSFDECMENIAPSTLACMIHFGEFNPTDNYFKFNGYGNLVSFDYVDIAMKYWEKDVKTYLLETRCIDSDIEELIDDSELIIMVCTWLVEAGY